MDDLAEFKQTYFQECDDLLADLERQLTALQEGEVDDEVLNAAFRAIHSIKGGAGAFGFAELVAFAHVFETVLDRMRGHELDTSSANIALMIRAADTLADLVVSAQEETEVPADFGQDILASLTALAGPETAGDEADDDDEDIDFAPVMVGGDEGGGSEGEAVDERNLFRIKFVPFATLFERANEPILLFRELKRLGAFKAEVDISKLPELEAIEPDGSYFVWDIELETTSPKSAIEEVFEFASNDCDLDIEEVTKAKDEVKEVVQEAETAPSPSPKKTKPCAPAAVKPAAAKAGAAEKKAPATIRVDLERIDRLVNMVGELVITQAMLGEQASHLAVDQHAGLIHGIEVLAQQMRELQESVMAIRAQPVKSVFSRMPRLVRELAGSLNKEARLVISGEHTEVDKTVIEELSDPLTHMIRNSMDHGLEMPDDREEAGKPREGTIYLSAEHSSGRIVISVSDDGRGINRDKVLQKARDKGLVSTETRPSDDEIDNMILLPGFSTADQVSNVSGRGVGMDVVVSKIQNMGGRIGISSVPGRGSKFNLTLPLTLAVLDGMVVRVGAENYIIPIASIVETLRPDEQRVNRLATGGEVLKHCDDYIKLIHLSELFGSADMEVKDSLVVIVETGGGRIGLVVSELVGQQQVVIKSLESNYRRIDGIAGATILGNGLVALILDVDGLRSIAMGKPEQEAAHQQMKEMH
ncbi:MAG: chemotaxis protein CheA [Geminicoccales bacterium]